MDDLSALETDLLNLLQTPGAPVAQDVKAAFKACAAARAARVQLSVKRAAGDVSRAGAEPLMLRPLASDVELCLFVCECQLRVAALDAARQLGQSERERLGAEKAGALLVDEKHFALSEDTLSPPLGTQEGAPTRVLADASEDQHSQPREASRALYEAAFCVAFGFVTHEGDRERLKRTDLCLLERASAVAAARRQITALLVRASSDSERQSGECVRNWVAEADRGQRGGGYRADCAEWRLAHLVPRADPHDADVAGRKWERDARGVPATTVLKVTRGDTLQKKQEEIKECHEANAVCAFNYALEQHTGVSFVANFYATDVEPFIALAKITSYASSVARAPPPLVVACESRHWLLFRKEAKSLCVDDAYAAIGEWCRVVKETLRGKVSRRGDAGALCEAVLGCNRKSEDANVWDTHAGASEAVRVEALAAI